MHKDTEIAPGVKASRWVELRPRLEDATDLAAWNTAIEILRTRLESRFFGPIAALQALPSTSARGAGFAIVALDCLLIDTIQSFREGRVIGSEGKPARAFKTFLRDSKHLRSAFSSAARADFFDSVRNGILHDGETRKDWRILAGSSDRSILERDPRGGYILYRRPFHRVIVAEWQDYLKALASGDLALRNTFVRRMDSICGDG